MPSKDTREIKRDNEGHIDKVIKTHETEDEITTKVYKAEHGILGTKEGHKISETREKK